MISVIIPTIAGRESLLEETCEAFRETTGSVEFVVVRNQPTCGEGWNVGMEQASGEYVLLGGDDIKPHAGWAETAIDAAGVGVYPSPLIFEPDGSILCAGTLGHGLYVDGKDGMPVYNSPIPFFRREIWDLIGPVPPIHYFADDYLAYKARFVAGLSVEVRRGYWFTHMNGTVGRQENVQRGEFYRQTYARAVSEEVVCES